MHLGQMMCCILWPNTTFPPLRSSQVSFVFFLSVMVMLFVVESLVVPISNFCVFMHITMKHAAKKYLKELRRNYYIEDAKFVDLFHVFHKYLKKKKKELDKSTGRLKGGIQKLAEMHRMV